MPYQPYQSTWQNPYIPQVQQPQYSPAVTPYSQPVNGVIKVNGRDSAMQYQLPPNSMSPALFDNNGKVFYIVSTDGTGMKTVEAFDFQPHVDEQPVKQVVNEHMETIKLLYPNTYDSVVQRIRDL